jgi:hypothetical protein
MGGIIAENPQWSGAYLPRIVRIGMTRHYCRVSAIVREPIEKRRRHADLPAPGKKADNSSASRVTQSATEHFA